MNLVKHLEKEIQSHHFSEKRFLLAVSGGEDSMALLHAFHKTGYPILVAHVNYKLRGIESDLDQKLVENYCKANNIECYTNSEEIQTSKGIQEKARELRYRWFEKLKEITKHDIVVTAHHKSDSVETVLFNLVRGSGLSGLSGITTFSNGVFRPLIHVNKTDISAFVISEAVQFRLDKSNLESKYSRNKIRNEIIPLLEQVNSGAVSHIHESASTLRQANSLVKYTVNKIWDSNITKEDERLKLKLDVWVNEPFAQTVLFEIGLKSGLNSQESKEVTKLLSSSSGKAIITSRYRAWRNRGEVIFQPIEVSNSKEFYLEIPVEGAYDLPNATIDLCTVKNDSVFEDDMTVLNCAVEELKWPLVIRSWRAGDRFRPFGMLGTQKVSDLLTQKKISLLEKQNILVLENAGEILWVLGVRTSEFTRVKPESKYFLKALISE